MALFKSGKTAEAIVKFREALRLKPDYGDAEIFLGLAFTFQGKTDEAVTHFREAVRLKPEDAEARNNLANALDAQGARDEAILQYQEALRLKPDYVDAHQNLAGLLVAQGRSTEAITHFRAVLQKDPNYTLTLNHLAWLLATNPDAGMRNGKEAVELAKRACDLTARKQGLALSVLAAAYAETGHFREAVTTVQEAVRWYRERKNDQRLRQVQEQLAFYRAHRPCRETGLLVE